MGEVLASKVVIITGAGSGIGAATARLFAEQGAHIVIAEVDQDKAHIVANELHHLPIEVDIIQTDVSDFDQVKKLIDQTVMKFGKLDILVNNAGIATSTMTRTAEHSIEDWNKVIAINQYGVFYGMKYALQHMVKQGHGNIVNVASLAGLKASGNNLAYSASKFAVVGMTKSAALEYARSNIRINCVCPGYTHSALFHQVLEIDDTLHDKLLKYIPMRRYGQPEEIAEAILWLASDKTSFITGQAIVLDGGLSL